MMATSALRTAATRSCSPSATPANLKPILWTVLPFPTPYLPALTLQETLVDLRLRHRGTPLDRDVLLLQQHAPVYTTGRRDKDPAYLESEKKRLGEVGADFVSTARGGQVTYHGPGQITGYPLLDIGAMNMTTRCYVDRVATFLSTLLSQNHSLKTVKTEHIGAFLSPTLKVGSIGIHVRRRITLHGFALNVDERVRPWFERIVACGLGDVEMTSIEREIERGNATGESDIEKVLPEAARVLGDVFGREMEKLDAGKEEHEEIWKVVKQLGKLPPVIQPQR